MGREGITSGYEKSSVSDKHIYYLGCGDGFLGAKVY